MMQVVKLVTVYVFFTKPADFCFVGLKSDLKNNKPMWWKTVSTTESPQRL